MLKNRFSTCLSQHWQALLFQHPSHTIAAAVTFTIGLFIPQVIMNLRTYAAFDHIQQEELRLQSLSNRATYLDEVLTMSALMYAATRDRTWAKRYDQALPELDAIIQESMTLSPHDYSGEDAQQMDSANRALIAIEKQAFQLIQRNQQSQAIRLLNSSVYKAQKQRYTNGVTQRNFKIQQQLQIHVQDYRTALKWSWLLMIISLLLLVPTWFIVLQTLRMYLRDRQITESALQQKNQDLTEALDQLQQAQRVIQTEKLSSLAQMVAGVAHEINNPVSFIEGNLTYVETYIEDLLQLVKLYQQTFPNPPDSIEAKLQEMDYAFIAEDFEKVLRSMRLGTHRIAEIVTGLRTFSRLDESDRKTVDLHSGLESAILLLRHRLNTTLEHPEIELCREYGNLPNVECCPGQLNQVFHGLILNAIEAIETGQPEQPKILIRTAVIDQNWVRIAIIDNGVGIPFKQQTKIFDPFFTTKPIGKGKGLGLSISHQIVTEYHQGKLFFVSTQAQETEFVIEIPLSSKV